jgi:2'-5' RNA ligase
MDKRIFVAIDISDKARASVADYIENLRRHFAQIRVGWERAEKLHLTMKFLGDIDETRLENLIEAVENTARQVSDFKLQISSTGVFPSLKKARILWLGLEDEKGSLRNLNEILEVECEKLNFAKEKRDFKPHLTIARLREPHKSLELVRAHVENDFKTSSFDVNEVIVFQSELQTSGSLYTPLYRRSFS